VSVNLYGPNFRYGPAMDLGYARVSTAKQDLERQVDALTMAGIPLEHIYVDKKSGATTDRAGLRNVVDHARTGDVIVVHTLDRLGRTVRDTLNLIHDLAGRGVGIRNLADPIMVDSSKPGDPMAQLAVVMLALFAQMERTYMLERAAHARSVAIAHGRQVGRPVTVDAGKLDYARRLRDHDGLTIPEIVERTGLTRSTLYRHLPSRPVETLTAAGSTGYGTRSDVIEAVRPVTQPAEPDRSAPSEGGDGILQSVTWPHGYHPPCPVCAKPTSGLRERNARVGREPVVIALAQPCGCGVDEHAAALQLAAPASA
jgi:DNA invertase Pin-like site-specific DNA recombinase